MVFNGKAPDIPNWRPKVHGSDIEMVAQYSYLGIVIICNGKFRQATNSLYRKGLGSYFSLRSTVDRRFVDASCLDKLFNSLVKPVLLYGCQVWAPTLPTITKVLSCFKRDHNLNTSLTHLAKNQLEQVHLRHLKYLLGINRRATNAAAWGETGSYPLMIEMLKLSVKYFKRIIGLPATQLVKAALTDQVTLRLSWYTGIEDIIKYFNNIDPSSHRRNSSSLLNATSFADSSNADEMVNNLHRLFTDSWRTSIETSRKLSFYNKIKTVFAWEPYLNHSSSFDDRKSTAQIRCSSHKLRIEVGRYDNTPLENRTCTFCELSASLQVVEDEEHLLTTCPLGKNIRDSFLRIIESMDISHGTSMVTLLVCTQDQYTNMSEQDMHQIRLLCSTIRKTYRLNLKFKDSLKDIDGS